ncbi:hypothetical protein V5799_027150 [Amblyomma americanum]|uniref:Galectin n=1 Tax=Amblyomma americanum TaxID=6943 RepID=A0AAQ4DGJ3_AMBAM
MPPPPQPESGSHTPKEEGAPPASDQPPPEQPPPEQPAPGAQTPPAGEQPPPAAEAPPAGEQPPPEAAPPRKASAESLLASGQTPSMDAVQMLNKVRQVDGIHYRVPVTPDHFLIPGNMTEGTEVYIFGLLAPQAQRCSRTLFLRSLEIKFREAKTLEKVSLLIHASLQPAPNVVLKTYQNKASEDVANSDASLAAGGALCCRVKAYGDGSAKVIVNERVLTFPPRDGFPLDKVMYFSLHGDFFTGSVSVFKKAWREAGYRSLLHLHTLYTRDGRFRRMIINILRSHDVHDDVLLGVVAQFAEQRQLVRRTKQEGVWLEDQVDQELPFEQGQPFVVDISVAEEDFQMSVNGKLLPPYKHKVFYGIGHNLCLEKNVKFKSLHVCSISQPPVSGSITLEPNNCFYVQGTPLPHAKEFKVMLAKGGEPTSDALLVIHVQIPQGLVFVYDGQDANKGAGYQIKVKVNRLFSCRADCHADSFKVWVNTFTSDSNAEGYEVKHRFPVNEVTHLSMFGDIKDVSGLRAVEDVAH